MGFFDKLFGGKTEQEETVKFFGQSKTVLTPIRGKVLAQADIPDETFAQGILGPGCGIEPTGKTVYAPFDGTVEQVASTLHAVGLTSEDGIEILIHVGMDTVEMQGKGFKALVKVGDKVKAGTPLLKVDLDAIRAAGHPTATAIIVTNGDDMGELKMLAEGDVLASAGSLIRWTELRIIFMMRLLIVYASLCAVVPNCFWELCMKSAGMNVSMPGKEERLS